MNEITRFAIFILSLFFIYKISCAQTFGQRVLGAVFSSKDIAVRQSVSPMISTITSFEEKEEMVEEAIPYETVYVKNANLEIGEKSVEKEGIDGKWIRAYKVTYWYGEEAKRELLNTEKEPAQNEVVNVGTKIVWRKVDTLGEKNVSDAKISYWKKMPDVWATSYDKSCYGCNEDTALGAKLDYGICAVDPKKIKLYTRIYVPGYGICQALDVGGAIEGNKIDVGFYDLHAQSPEVGWKGAHYTSIYLLDNEEANLTLLP
ncbi:hypothetical protein COT69_01445 [candidate division WWE3 bacterium CG09_land_8_20_14_0_10_39_24]|uniref:G5 domain-containing protein n=1 Tax=candidate division WWE3 bacterium CG09_land_8_20_14_0_10_39_24 TaxID=1975088 RepID=A0A2H0WJQ8_UNCKA|nr:MAG: hypothetical protein BK003_01420 [bacterium CG09_39_24]PIS12923.1 MAG: hypothetical protein COT69_01445 [candidate division WWE3 bacterium CG09_land_8_20_14_0_10_39_24]